MRRLSPKINLFLAALSVLLGVVGILQDQPSKLLFIISLVILSLIVFTLLLPRWKNIPIRDNVNLSQSCAEKVLRTAIEPESGQYPLCAHLTTFHSAGLSVSGLVAKTVCNSMSYILIMLLHREEEMQNEKLFSPSSVQDHLKRLRRIHAILSGLLSEANLVPKCYVAYTDANHTWEALRKVCDDLEHDVIDRMDEFFKAIPKDVDSVRGEKEIAQDIKQLIQVEIPSALTTACRNLAENKNHADDLCKVLQQDWRENTRFLWNDPLCKPIPVTLS